MASNYPNLDWNQVAPGVWQRGIDEIEELYATLRKLYEGSGRMVLAITGYASLSIKVHTHQQPLDVFERLVDNALRKAWLTLRYHHPTIAARAMLETGTSDKWIKTYHQFKDEADKMAWLEKTCVSIATGQTGLEWANSDPPAPDLPTLFIIEPSQVDGPEETCIIRRDLVFRAPHDIIDGIGTLIMLNNLLIHAAEAYDLGDAFVSPVFDGSEAMNLSPVYRVAANVPTKLTRTQELKLEYSVFQRNEVTSNSDVEVLALPYRHGALTPGRSQRAALTLSTDKAVELVKACKIANATPTCMFHAAAAIAIRDIQERRDAKKVRYVSFTLRNNRAHCLEPYNSEKHPVTLYHFGSVQSLAVDISLPAVGNEPSQQSRKQEFRSVVDTVKEFYLLERLDVDHPIIAPYLCELGLTDIKTLSASLGPLQVPPPRTDPSVSMSSLGRVTEIICPEVGSFRVHDAWVTADELSNGYSLFLQIYNGQLTLSATYNDAWHTKEDVLGFLDRCVDIVFQGFSIFSD